ncbi:lysophospholipase D GDPD1-like [Mya arenaria]|uniref:lysophospholipase D GDPD1-like n=1 Tax=Mya arenaria TaxID=6604 RepID=UPI0022E64424|nr:lysophospholipase D GDPD1-like [Mya arenaria]XP_052799675.1 lysophospholipase D GDPD1-like [Mya arenaria]
MDIESLITMVVLATLAGGYIVASLILLRFPQILHRRKKLLFRPVHISHRGGAGENCENTVTAFKHALAQGSQMLEVDVHLTRDGEVVVSHDGHLKGKFGVDANIADIDLINLPKYKSVMSVDFKPGFTVCCGGDCNIPTLRDVFTKFSSTPINIDIKVHNETLIHKVHELIKEFRREDLSVWGGRASVTTKYLHKLDPSIPLFFSFQNVLSLVIMFYTGLLPFVPIKESTLEIIMPSIAFKSGRFSADLPLKFRVLLRIADTLLMRPALFRHLERRGIQTYLWVLNDDEDYERAFKLGVAGVMTDFPSKLAHFLQEHPQYAAHWRGTDSSTVEEAQCLNSAVNH